MKKFRCTVCGYVYEGDAAPEKCPLCKAQIYYILRINVSDSRITPQLHTCSPCL